MLDLMCEPPPGGGRLTSLARRGRAKRTLPGRFSGPTVYQALLSGPSVILPDDHKQALCTAPNARPLSSVVAGKCKLNQMDAVAARLMHNHPSGDATLIASQQNAIDHVSCGSLASKAAEAVRPCTSATPQKADVNLPPWLPPLSARSRHMQRSKIQPIR